MSLKRAIVVTIFRVPNYGSVLQAFATQLLLRNLDIDADLLDYRPEYKMLKNMSLIDRCKMIITIVMGCLGLHKKQMLRRNLNLFIKDRLSITKPYASISDISVQNWDLYDFAVAGSDQIWNPRFNKADTVYMLSFVPDHIPKISIASSFACDRLPEDSICIYKKWLSRFKALTVRETNGVDILKHQLGLNDNIGHILDPTLLISGNEWLKILDINVSDNPKRYIVLYYLSYAFNTAPYIFEITKYLKSKYDLDVYVISDNQQIFKKYGLKGFKDKTGLSVPELVKLFVEAEMLVTSSFHGTAFAVNFGKPLVSIIPETGDKRQVSLLKQLGIENCAVSVTTNFEEVNPYYDSVQEQLSLSALRRNNMELLRDYLN